jgi:hypothetical protein
LSSLRPIQAERGDTCGSNAGTGAPIGIADKAGVELSCIVHCHTGGYHSSRLKLNGGVAVSKFKAIEILTVSEQ